MKKYLCGKCGEADREMFYDSMNWQCKKCMRLYNKKYYQKFKPRIIKRELEKKKKLNKFVREIRGELSCITCGENHPAVLDFHHRDPNTKDFSISQARYKTEKRIIEEMKKCDVLCSNCHRILHWEMGVGL